MVDRRTKDHIDEGAESLFLVLVWTPVTVLVWENLGWLGIIGFSIGGIAAVHFRCAWKATR